jgi:hypothetical protein
VNKHIVWKIRCIDRNTKALFDRDLVLDQAATSAIEMADINAILDAPDRGQRIQLLKYRDRFKEVAPGHDHTADSEAAGGFNIFCLPDFFEDREGNPLATCQMLDIQHGQNVVVAHDPMSVMRFGPKEMANASDWTTEKANTIAHFLEVMECLGQSDWIRARAGFTKVIRNDGTSRITRFDRPNVLVLNSILGFTRQLIFSDDLFDSVISIYLEHCSDDMRRWWIQMAQGSFTGGLDCEPFGLHVADGIPQVEGAGVTGRQMLRHFFYSFGLLHHPEPNQVRRFRELIARFGRENVMMAFHNTCAHLVCTAYGVAQVIGQDFHHWMTQGHTSPDRVSISDVLGEIRRS